MSIRNNFIKLSITPDILGKLLPGWRCSKNKLNRAILPESAWMATYNFVCDNYKNLSLKDEADLCSVYHDLRGNIKYLCWLEFVDKTNNRGFKLDVYIPEFIFNNTRQLLATRFIDSACPTVELVRNLILFPDTFDKAERIKLCSELKEILATRNGYNLESTSSKLQYKLNGTFTEDAFVFAVNKTKKLSTTPIYLTERDKYNSYFYIGSPGNICDFILTIGDDTWKVDLKLIKNSESLPLVRKAAHDADYIICYNMADKSVITDQITTGITASLPSNLIYQSIASEFGDYMTKNFSSLLKIKNINTEDGIINFERYN